MSSLDADPLLRRLERRALVFCALAAVATLVVQGGRYDVALGVVGGGVLIGVSYWAIRSSIDGILALALPAVPPAGPTTSANAAPRPPEPDAQPSTSGAAEAPASAVEEGHAPRRGDSPARESGRSSRQRALMYGFRFVGRYAVLAALAYVMLVWLRLHPVGLILGVSSIVVAAAIEAAGNLSRRG